MDDRIIELVTELVAVPTHESEHDAQVLLAGRLTAAGFECRLHQLEPGRTNLIAVRGTGGAFLCSHIDVHPPHSHPEPWTVHRSDGDLIGRGVLDAKGQIAALVAAVEHVPAEAATILITCDEEFTGIGSDRAELPADLDRSEGGLVLEPTAFVACTAQSGCIDIRLEARATPAHAYATERPPSALDVLDGTLDALDGCSFLRQRHPLLPAPTRKVGTLSAGEHLWRTPATASARVALGLVPGVDTLEAREEVASTLDALSVAWSSQDASLRYEILDASDAIDVGERVPALARLLAAERVEIGGMPSWTDAANLYTRHGLPCVVFGAGDLAAAHSDRESVALPDLVRLAEVLARFIAG